VPSHFYSLSFEPNPHWSGFFSKAPEIQSYLEGVADKHGIKEHVRFGVEVGEAAYDEATGMWHVAYSDVATGKQGSIAGNVFVSCVGQLDRPKVPPIPGREDFAGVAFHTANWKHDHDFAGKRVAVIGTGASAMQAARTVSAQCKHMTVFQQIPSWCSPNPNYHR
jgi:4-hydroxyacetophenone monooxygenase